MVDDKQLRRRLIDFRNGKVKTLRNPEKYRHLLTEHDYVELFNVVIPLEDINNLIDKKYNSKISTALKHKSSIKSVWTLFTLDTFEDLLTKEITVIEETIKGKFAETNVKSIYSALNIVFDGFPWLKEKYPDKYNFIIENRKKVVYKEHNESKEDLEKIYTDIINFTAPQDLKLIHTLYTKAIYDSDGKLVFIPNNCFHNILLVDFETVESPKNSYNYDTAKFKIGAHEWTVSPEVKEEILNSIGSSPRLYLISNRTRNMPINSKLLNNKIELALGVKLNQYRRALGSLTQTEMGTRTKVPLKGSSL